MRKLHHLLFIFLLANTTLFSQADILVHADQMPYFMGCEDLKDGSEEKRKCSNEALAAFLANNVHYPNEAKEQGTEGTVYVSFVVDENGKVTKPSVLRDIGNGCGVVALEVLNKMPDWEAGVHDDKKVKVKLNLPIQFNLKNNHPTSVGRDDHKITWGTLKGHQVSVAEIKKHIESEIIVRDQFGEPVIYDELIVAYKKGEVVQTLQSNGILDKKQKKLLKKVKSGGLVYVGVVIHKGEKKIQVGREFEVQ